MTVPYCFVARDELLACVGPDFKNFLALGFLQLENFHDFAVVGTFRVRSARRIQLVFGLLFEIKPRGFKVSISVFRDRRNLRQKRDLIGVTQVYLFGLMKAEVGFDLQFVLLRFGFLRIEQSQSIVRPLLCLELPKRFAASPSRFRSNVELELHKLSCPPVQNERIYLRRQQSCSYDAPYELIKALRIRFLEAGHDVPIVLANTNFFLDAALIIHPPSAFVGFIFRFTAFASGCIAGGLFGTVFGCCSNG